MARSTQYGYSLLEVLVSILVLAFGVIGAAGMQLTALRTTQQSGFQTIATQLASEMADKMRSNDSQMKLGDAGNPFLAVNYKSAVDGDPTPPAKFCYTVKCDAAELAKFEIYEWQQRVKASLPSGRVRVCRDASPWDDAAKALSWDCDAASAGGSLVIKVGWQGKNPDGTLVKNGAGTEFPPSVALTVLPYAP